MLGTKVAVGEGVAAEVGAGVGSGVLTELNIGGDAVEVATV